MGQGDAKCEHDVTNKVDPVCPECGTPCSERSPATPWAVRHRLLLKLAALALVLGFIVWQNVLAWPVMSAPSTFYLQPEVFPAHQYTRRDLVQYATGAITDGQLIDDLLVDYMLGSSELVVALVDPAGGRTSGVSYGWPTEIASYTWSVTYEDVYARTNPIANTMGFTSGWRGLLYYQNKIDEEGRFESFNFHGKALVGPLFLVVAAWSLGRVLRSLLVFTHIYTESGTRVRDRMVGWLPASCAILCALSVTVGSIQPTRSPDYIRPIPSPSPLEQTGLTITDLARLSEQPGGEAAIAGAILTAIAKDARDPDGSLVFGFALEEDSIFSYGSGGWPAGYIYSTYERVNWDRNNAASRPEITFLHGGSTLVIIAGWGDSGDRFTSLDVSTVSLALIGLLLYAAWWFAGIAVWLIAWKTRRRAAKRVAQGWCARCGYDLDGL